MALLNVTVPGKTGVAPPLVATAGGGDSFPILGTDQKFHFKNTDVAGRTVTLIAQKACPLGVLHNIVLAVPAGTERVIDGVDPAYYADVNGRVQLTYDAATGLTAGSYA